MLGMLGGGVSTVLSLATWLARMLRARHRSGRAAASGANPLTSMVRVPQCFVVRLTPIDTRLIPD